MKPLTSNPFRPHLFALAALLAASSVHAADGTWNGISGNWSNTTDPGGVWSGGIFADLIDSNANFTGVDIAADQTITLDAPRTIGNITFTDLTTSSNNLTISGANTLTLDRSAGAPVIDVTQADRTLAISSVVAGTDGLQKSGPGTLTLTGLNTYTGNTTISGGTLRLEGTGGGFFSSTSATRNYSISTGAVLNLHNAFVPVGVANISGTGTLLISGTGISAGDDLRDVNMNMDVGSVIEIASGSALYNGGWQAFTWSNNKATLTVNGELNIVDGNAVVAGALAGNGTIGASGSGSASLFTGNGNVSGSFGGSIIHGLSGGTRVVTLTKSGTGTQTLSGNNSYTGTTAISNGILAITHNNALGSTTGNTTISASGSSTGPMLYLSGNINSPENISLNGNSETAQYQGVITNTSGTNTLSGNITLANPSGNIRITCSAGELIFSGTINQTTGTRTLVFQAVSGAAITVNNAIANNNGGLNILGNAFDAGVSNGVTLKGGTSNISITNVLEKGVLKLGVSDALKTTANLNIGTATTLTAFDRGTVDLAGFNQTVAALIGTKNTGGTIALDSARIVTNSATSTTSILTVGNSNATGTFNGVILDGAGAVALVKTGSGTQTLTGANTYSGNTTVNGGTLTLNNPNANNQSSTVTIASAGATLNLNYAGTDTVDKLFIGATQLAAGVYGNSGSVLPVIARSEITGTGTLTVSSGPSAGGYAAWQSLNGAGANLSDDHDNDGVDNGTEYFIGGPTGNTTGFTALPGVINNLGTLSVTFTKAAGYTGIYGTHYLVQTSDTLVGTWLPESANPTPGFTVTFPSATEVKYTFPNPLGTRKFARLKVTGP